MEGAKHTQTDLESLESISADQALFEGRIRGLAVAFRQDQRPLQGLAGLLDWRFEGAISRCLMDGSLTGAPGECAYLPLGRAGTTYHLLLLGAGSADASGEGLPAESLKALKKNLVSLKLERIGVSRADLGKSIATALKGVPVCITR